MAFTVLTVQYLGDGDHVFIPITSFVHDLQIYDDGFFDSRFNSGAWHSSNDNVFSFYDVVDPAACAPQNLRKTGIRTIPHTKSLQNCNNSQCNGCRFIVALPVSRTSGS